MLARAIKPWALVVLVLAIGSLNAAAQTLEDIFNDEIVQELRLTVRPSDWQTLKANYLLNVYYPADFAWRYQGKDVVLPQIGIRSRGQGSRSPIKPSLRLDMNRFDDTQELLGVKSLVLRNNSQDASEGLHERLSMMIFTRLGFPASREAHVRLYVNGEYAGLYTFVESVDKHWLDLSFNGDKEGYLFEWKWVDPPYFFTYLGTNLALYSADGVHWQAETHQNDPLSAIAGPLEAMVKTINQSSDANFVSAVSPYLDLKQFMAHIAVENFIADNDGIIGDYGMNNFWFYRFTGKNLGQFIPWDKSEALSSLEFDVRHNIDTNVLSKKAWAVPELRQAYFDTLARCAAMAGGPGGWLDKETQFQYNQIHAAALADPNRLCKDAGGMPAACSVAQYEDGSKAVMQFTANRAEKVKAMLAANGYELRATNGASFAPNDLSAGSIISIFGTGLAGSAIQATALPLPTDLGGASVKINGVAAPLFYVSPNQINLQVPWEIAPGAATITATLNGATSLNPPISTTISAASPGVFAVVHADGSAVTPSSPAKANEVVLVYANGLGAVNGTVQTGQPATAAAATRTAATATVGQFKAAVQYAGLAPGWVGLYQVNVQLPSRVFASDRAELLLKIGSQLAIPVNISTR